MDRLRYDATILARLHRARPIPFQVVQIDGWRPSIAQCHGNVDTWIAASPGSRAVRGWATHYHGALTAHSVVAGPDGVLFDITPLGDERLRPTMLFVAHLGSEQEFQAAKEASIFLYHTGHIDP